MIKIEKDSFGVLVTVLERDFFAEDYENADELIHEIEEFYTLSRKEKELLRKINYTKGIEEVVDNG